MYSSKKVIIQYVICLFVSNITDYYTTLLSISNAKYSATALFISHIAHQSISRSWSLRRKRSIPPDDQFHNRKDEIYKGMYSPCLSATIIYLQDWCTNMKTKPLPQKKTPGSYCDKFYQSQTVTENQF
jgi:hypothetical protein